MKDLSDEIETREFDVNHCTPLTLSRWPLKEKSTFGTFIPEPLGSQIMTEFATLNARRLCSLLNAIEFWTVFTLAVINKFCIEIASIFNY
jgi:hypothetical protein